MLVGRRHPSLVAIVTMAAALLSASAPCMAGVTDEERTEAVDFHNYLRRNVVPRAADMNALFWQDSLAELAQKAADRCVFEHNYDGEYAGLGENLYKGGRRNMTEILMMMFLERELYNYTSNKCNTGSGAKYPMFTSCGHYYQIAAASVSFFGCGIANCDGFYIVACEYDRMYTNPPYIAGEPGTKCGHNMATWYQNGLCYRKVYWSPGPSGAVECKIGCLNGGTLIESHCICSCAAGFDGVKCENYYNPALLTTSCAAQLVECSNGGTPTMFGNECKCVCPPGYRGDRCQVNAAQADNSVYWYFGQQMRYISYYPVNATIWNRTLPIQNCVQQYLTAQLVALCKSNFKVCCPEADSDTNDEAFVDFDGYSVTDFYPAGAIDGTLKVGTYMRMRQQFVGVCNLGIGQLVNGAALLKAAAAAAPLIRYFTDAVGVAIVRYDDVPDF